MTPEQIRDAWNAQADEYNQWDTLSWQEIVEWTLQCVQDKQRQWVGLTDEEIQEFIGPWGDTPIKGYTRKLFDQIEAKLKEKNT
jgi:hypothetical protein